MCPPDGMYGTQDHWRWARQPAAEQAVRVAELNGMGSFSGRVLVANRAGDIGIGGRLDVHLWRAARDGSLASEVDDLGLLDVLQLNHILEHFAHDGRVVQQHSMAEAAQGHFAELFGRQRHLLLEVAAGP